MTSEHDAGRHELVRRARPPRHPHARQGDHRVRGRGRSTYGEMAAAGQPRWPAGLAERGVGRGDVVGLLSYNCPEFLETIFAANYLGAIAMPINWRLAAPEVRYILEHSGARALVCDESARRPGRRGDQRASRTALGAGLRIAPAAGEGGPTLADLRTTPSTVDAGAGAGRRRPPADVHVGHHRTAQGRHDHPRQPGVEEPGPHRRVRLHRAPTSGWPADRSTTSARSTSRPPR